MKIICIADVMGNSGKDVLNAELPKLIEEEKADLVIVNGENIAGGFGITPRTASGIFRAGADIITLGNHTWDRKEGLAILDDKRVVRPANYPSGAKGQGYVIHETKANKKVAVINLMGRVFMLPLECPFRTIDRILEEIQDETNIVIVDVHAEATSEKVALGWYLDGRVSAVFGTHTHVATADEKILPNGTAYITDLGLTGSHDSVIGVKKELIIEKFLTQLPVKYSVGDNKLVMEGIVLNIDDKTGKAKSITRIKIGDYYVNKI